MMRFPMIAALVAAAPLAAQVTPGDPMPEFTIDAAFNQAPASFSGFRNKAVLVDLFATW